MIKTKVIKQAEKVENELNNAKLKYDTNLLGKGFTAVYDLLDCYGLNIMQVEQDGLNCLISYDDELDNLQLFVKHDVNDVPAVNDLAWMYNHDFFDYVYIDGYNRVEPVSCDNMACQIDDIITFINDRYLD